MITHHSFSVTVATKLASIEQAILLEHIAFLSQSNCFEAVKRSARAMRIIYPYLTERCIRLSLSRLETFGYIKVIEGQPDDPTKTYILTKNGWDLLGYNPEYIITRDEKHESYVINERLKPWHEIFFGERERVYVDKNSNVLPQALFTINDNELEAIQRSLQVFKINTDVVKLIYEFILFASGSGRYYQNTIDLRTHFFNWSVKRERNKINAADQNKPKRLAL